LYSVVTSVSWWMFAFVVLGLFSSIPHQYTGWEECLQNDLFCVEWDVKPYLLTCALGCIDILYIVCQWTLVYTRLNLTFRHQPLPFPISKIPVNLSQKQTASCCCCYCVCLQAMFDQPFHYNIVRQVTAGNFTWLSMSMLAVHRSNLQFGRWTAGDNVKQCLPFATSELVSCCKAPFLYQDAVTFAWKEFICIQ